MKASTGRVRKLLEDGIPVTKIIIETGWDGDEVRALWREMHMPQLAQGGIVKARPVMNVPVKVVPEVTIEAKVRMVDRDLIAEGLASSTRSVNVAAQRAKDALDRLADMVAENRERDAAKKRIADLKEQLRRAEADLYGAPDGRRYGAGARPPVGISYKAVKDWAREQGIDVGHGRPTNALVEQYQAAQEVAS